MGFCGSVWASVSESLTCMKREDGGPGRSLMNEYHIHKLVNQAIASNPQHAVNFSVPLCHGFLGKDDPEWPGILPRLPAGSAACNALLSEKVQAISEPARRQLATAFGPGHDPEAIVADRKNEHCLIRPYLGRRRHRRTGRPTFFSLRNFPFHIDQMEELEIEVDPYAKTMAEGLAFLLWVARVDANDVEFALGLPRTTPACPESQKFHNNALGTHSMWVIDFDCCKELSMDEEGIEVAARFFWRNDPFYPRPGGPRSNASDQRLWGVFREHFLQTSEMMLRHESPSIKKLPALLMSRIAETRGKYDKGTVL
ncbi:hypothetical protein ACJ41O_008464 [Fusarium nematophilum]